MTDKDHVTTTQCICLAFHFQTIFSKPIDAIDEHQIVAEYIFARNLNLIKYQEKATSFPNFNYPISGSVEQKYVEITSRTLPGV